MKKQAKGYKQIILNVPEEMVKKAGATLKVKGIELKDYILDIFKKSIEVKKKDAYTNDSIWGISRLGKSKVKNLSVSHDKYLYGVK